MPCISILQLNIPIPTPDISQPVPLIIVCEMSTPTIEEIAEFGEDVVVSLREYFWIKTKKDVVKQYGIGHQYMSSNNP